MCVFSRVSVLLCIICVCVCVCVCVHQGYCVGECNVCVHQGYCVGVCVCVTLVLVLNLHVCVCACVHLHLTECSIRAVVPKLFLAGPPLTMKNKLCFYRACASSSWLD